MQGHPEGQPGSSIVQSCCSNTCTCSGPSGQFTAQHATATLHLPNLTCVPESLVPATLLTTGSRGGDHAVWRARRAAHSLARAGEPHRAELHAAVGPHRREPGGEGQVGGLEHSSWPAVRQRTARSMQVPQVPLRAGLHHTRASAQRMLRLHKAVKSQHTL